MDIIDAASEALADGGGDRKIGGMRAKNSCLCSRSAALSVGDDKRDVYLAAASDSSLSEQEREASVLFFQAEEHLEKEDWKDALSEANQALDIFKSLEKKDAVADTLRVLFSAMRMKAQYMRYNNQVGNKVVLKEAEQRALDRLREFKDQGDNTGLACMYLSLAEIYLEKSGQRSGETALQNANQALDLFKRIPDRKMEAQTQMVLSNIYYTIRNNAKGESAAAEASSIAQSLGDKKLEAKALGAMAVGKARAFDWSSAMNYMVQSLSLFQELDMRKQSAFQCHALAQWSLAREKPADALPAAKQAFAIFQELECKGQGWEACALYTMVQSLLMKEDTAQAMKIAKMGVERFESMEDKGQQLAAKEALLDVYLELDDFEEAAKIANDAIQICRAVKDYHTESIFLITLSQIQMHEKQMVEAMKNLDSSLSILEDLDEYPSTEAFARSLKTHMLYNTASVQEAQRSAEKALDFCKAEEDTVGEALALCDIAWGRFAMEERQEAIDMVQRSVAKIEEAGDFHALMWAYSFLCELHLQNKDYDQALEASKTRRRISQQIFSKRAQSYALFQMVRVNLDKGDSRQAVRYAEEAKDIMKKLRTKTGEAHALLRYVEAMVADTFTPDIDPDNEATIRNAQKTVAASREALQLAMGSHDRGLHAAAYFWQGEVDLLTGNYAEAVSSASEAINILRLLGDKAGQGQAQLIQARGYLAVGKRDQAMDLLHGCQQLFAEAGDAQGGMQCLELMEKMASGGRMQQQQYREQEEDAIPTPAVSVASVTVTTYTRPDPVLVRRKIMDVAINCIGDDNEIDLDAPLMDMGMDSLSSVQFRNDLQKEFGLSMAASLIFDHPTVVSLINYLSDAMEAKQITL